MRQRLLPVLAVVGRARRRRWLNETLLRAAWPIAAGTVLAAVAFAGLRLSWWPRDDDTKVLAAVALFAVALVVYVLGHGSRWLAAAQHLDQLTRGHDRLTTALWLAESAERGLAERAWVSVQHADASRFAGQLDVQRVLPVRLPRANGAWLVGAALATLAATVPVESLRLEFLRHGETSAGVAVELPSQVPEITNTAAALTPDDRDLLALDRALLRDVAAQVEDASVRAWVTNLHDLVDAAAAGTIDPRQALDQLAALEATRPQHLDQILQPGATPVDRAEAERQQDIAVREAIADAAKAAAHMAPPGPESDALARAAAEKDLATLAKIAQKIASKADDAQLEKWVRAMERFADVLKNRKVPEQFKELAERVRRLEERRTKDGGLSAPDQQRLRQARHELEQLRRTHGDVEGSRYRLDRLEREVRAAANEMRREQEARQGQSRRGTQQQPADAEGFAGRDHSGGSTTNSARGSGAKQRAADELRREAEGQHGREAMRVGEARMRDLREALERGSNRTAQRDDGGGGESQTDAAGEMREDGEKGHPQGRGGRGQRSARGGQRPAGGDKGEAANDEPMAKLGGGDLNGKSRMDLLREGHGQRGDSEQNPAGSGSKGSGAGTSSGNDGQRTDTPRPRARGRQDDLVAAAHGKGPDTKKVFLDVARKGFARQGWREVYGDYSEVAEEMIDKESLPPGRKALVRRYYELIRP
jgi:hypothetical protein